MAAITQLSQLDPEGSYTYADYLTWKFHDRVELLLGRIFKMSPAPSRKHQDISFRLSGLFFQYSRICNIRCRAYCAPFDVRLPDATNNHENSVPTVVQPDFVVVCDLTKLDDRGCLGAPDLVVEIVSPGNSRREMREKYRIYESSGVKEYWVVQPGEKVVHRYVLREGIFVGLAPVSEPDVLRTDLFPGWEIPLDDLFLD